MGLIFTPSVARRSKLNILFLVVAVGAWVLFGVILVQAAMARPSTEQLLDAAYPAGVAGWQAYLRAGLCVLAFIAGHLAYKLRWHYRHPGPIKTPTRPHLNPLVSPATGTMSLHTALIIQGALIAFFLFMTAALIYETIGTHAILDPGTSDLHPITTYVRHAIQVAPVRSTIVAGIVSFLLGHWLWYRA